MKIVVPSTPPSRSLAWTPANILVQTSISPRARGLQLNDPTRAPQVSSGIETTFTHVHAIEIEAVDHPSTVARSRSNIVRSLRSCPRLHSSIESPVTGVKEIETLRIHLKFDSTADRHLGVRRHPRDAVTRSGNRPASKPSASSLYIPSASTR